MTEPLRIVRAVDLTALIPTQRTASPSSWALPPNPVLVRQLAARPGWRPVLDRVTAVIIGVSLVAAILVMLLVIR